MWHHWTYQPLLLEEISAKIATPCAGSAPSPLTDTCLVKLPLSHYWTLSTESVIKVTVLPRPPSPSIQHGGSLEDKTTQHTRGSLEWPHDFVCLFVCLLPATDSKHLIFLEEPVTFIARVWGEVLLLHDVTVQVCWHLPATSVFRSKRMDNVT